MSVDPIIVPEMTVEEADGFNVAFPGGIQGTDLAFVAPDAFRDRLLEGRPMTNTD